MKRDENNCDDGNKNDKDGCSSICEQEFNWVCSGGSPTEPDTCKNIEEPRIYSRVMRKDPLKVALIFTK